MLKLFFTIMFTFSFHASQATDRCSVVLSDQIQQEDPWPELPGLERAQDLDQEKQGTNGGRWYRDSQNQEWFVKKDVYHNELQTSAEVISSKFYGALGYKVPVIEKIIIDGVHYVKVSKVENVIGTTRFEGMNEYLVRKLRVIAALLADYARVGNRANNLEHDPEIVIPPKASKIGYPTENTRHSFTLIDFGGTLGSKARGKHKDGEMISEATGVFPSDGSIFDIMASIPLQRFTKDRTTGELTVVPLIDEHPWRFLNMDDASVIIGEIKKTLTNRFIREVVTSARYSSKLDQEYIIGALIQRRDTIIEELAEYVASLNSKGEIEVEADFTHIHVKTDALEVQSMRISEDQKIAIYRLQAQENNSVYSNTRFYERLPQLDISPELRRELYLSSVNVNAVALSALQQFPTEEVTDDLIQEAFKNLKESNFNTDLYVRPQKGDGFEASSLVKFIEVLNDHNLKYELVHETDESVLIGLEWQEASGKTKSTLFDNDPFVVANLIRSDQVILRGVNTPARSISE